MKKLYLLILLAFCSIAVYAQDNVEFTADRPGASTGPSVVNGNQKCSDFGNSECSIFGIKTTVLLASAVQ